MRLQHIHLPSSPPAFPSYRQAASLQEHLRRQLLNAKDSPTHTPAPPPTLISFTPQPTYTLGRRQTSPLTAAETARLQAPLHVSFTQQGDSNSSSSSSSSHVYRPAILPSPRGGLATYHGPGQVVLWAVADLHAAGRPALTVRAYSRLLEDSTSRVLARLFGLATTTTSDPGVWVDRGGGGGGGARKVAAMGVHLRRHVSALGVAVNLDMPTDDGADELTSPWARIVACGLEGKGVTSVAGEVGREALGPGVERAVAAGWAEELARGLGVEGVESVGEDEVMELLRRVKDISDSGEGV